MNFNRYLNQHLLMSVVFMILHGLVTHNPVEVICAIVVTGAYLRFDALMNERRVFYRDAYNETLRDANRDLESMLANMRSVDIECKEQNKATVHRIFHCSKLNCDTPELCMKACPKCAPYKVTWREEGEEWPET